MPPRTRRPPPLTFEQIIDCLDKPVVVMDNLPNNNHITPAKQITNQSQDTASPLATYSSPSSSASSDEKPPKQQQQSSTTKSNHTPVLKRSDSSFKRTTSSKSDSQQSSPDFSIFPSALESHEQESRTSVDTLLVSVSMLGRSLSASLQAVQEIFDACKKKNTLGNIRRHNKMKSFVQSLVEQGKSSTSPLMSTAGGRLQLADVLYVVFRDNLNLVYAESDVMTCFVVLFSATMDGAATPSSDNGPRKTPRSDFSCDWLDVTPVNTKKKSSGGGSQTTPTTSHAITIPTDCETTIHKTQYVVLSTLVEMIQNCSAHIDSQGSEEGGSGGATTTRSFLTGGNHAQDLSQQDGKGTRKLSRWALEGGVFGAIADVLSGSSAESSLFHKSVEVLELLSVFLGTLHVGVRDDLQLVVKALRGGVVTATRSSSSTLRVLLNLSNYASAKAAMQQRAFIEEIGSMLTTSVANGIKKEEDDVQDTDWMDRPCTILCLLCNLCEGESINAESTRRFLVGKDGILTTVVGFVKVHFGPQGNTTEQSILASYAALLLGTILCNSPDLNEQVTDVMRAQCLTVRSLIAILQEFILFQSEAGVLTKSALVTVHTVIDELVKQNNIVLMSMKEEKEE